MFDFLDEDWFVIGVEILFLLFIGYDAYKFKKTRKREYLFNIVLAIGFAGWVLYPFYIKYYTWEEKDREMLIEACLKEHNATYCNCVDDRIFKEYDLESFKQVDKKNDTAFQEFLKASEQECFEE